MEALSDAGSGAVRLTFVRDNVERTADIQPVETEKKYLYARIMGKR